MWLKPEDNMTIVYRWLKPTAIRFICPVAETGQTLCSNRRLLVFDSLFSLVALNIAVGFSQLLKEMKSIGL
jgi:hypothetical protein